MSRLIRVGDQYINLDNVTKIEVESDEIVVYFLGDVDDYRSPANKQTYTGWLAEELEVELEAEVKRGVE